MCLFIPGNCSLTQAVMFVTLLINLFAGAESANLFIFLSFPFLQKSIGRVSSSMTKTEINCSHISPVASQQHNALSLRATWVSFFCARHSMYQIKMNLHGSEWDEPNWQWGFRVVAAVNGVLPAGTQITPLAKAVFFIKNLICNENTLLMQCVLMLMHACRWHW